MGSARITGRAWGRNHGRTIPREQGNRTVLVVDPDPEVTYILAEALRRWGYRTLVANTYPLAIKLARENPLEAVLLDVGGAGDGFRILEILRETNTRVIVVMMSGCSTLPEARRAMALGAYDYITKPFSPDAVRLILQRGLAENRRALARVG